MSNTVKKTERQSIYVMQNDENGTVIIVAIRQNCNSQYRSIVFY